MSRPKISLPKQTANRVANLLAQYFHSILDMCQIIGIISAEWLLICMPQTIRWIDIHNWQPTTRQDNTENIVHFHHSLPIWDPFGDSFLSLTAFIHLNCSWLESFVLEERDYDYDFQEDLDVSVIYNFLPPLCPVPYFVWFA